MKILYLSSVCSQSRFDLLVSKGVIKKMPQAQKYHHLLIEGLQKVSNDGISVISSYPINGGRKRVYKTEVEIESEVNYFYPGFIKFPIIRQICLILNSILLIFKLKENDTIIVCDILNGSVCYAARFVRLFTGIKIVSIVTDVPGLTSGARIKMLPWWKRILPKLGVQLLKESLDKYDGYLFLTQAMDEVVNFKHKPYIVIEGHSDITMKERINDIHNKFLKKTIMYAGGTHKEFGIALLVEAFLSVNRPDWELHIYGDGNYTNELKRIASKYKNVKYFGLRPNSEVVSNQLRAWILVNPRITDAEYIKYSFPSKTLECMVSGTPLLTTKLAGMPKEYYPYVYLFENETFEGFRNTLNNVFSLDLESLHKQGIKAKSFALNEKNNIVQAKKFYDFLQSVK